MTKHAASVYHVRVSCGVRQELIPAEEISAYEEVAIARNLTDQQIRSIDGVPEREQALLAGRRFVMSCPKRTSRWRSLLALVLASLNPIALAQLAPDDPQGQALIERLRQGGLVVFFRHADTAGMPCDRSYRIGQREGQRNLSEDGRAQAREIGETLAALGIPVQEPILAGPVFRARDTAELAFGAERVEVTDSLLADDYAGSRGVRWVLAEHRRLFATPPAPGLNRILVGHRTPALMSVDGRVSREGFPEGAAIVVEPRDGTFEVLGVISFVPPPNPGVDRC